MVDGALATGVKRQPASLSSDSQPFCEKDVVTDSAVCEFRAPASELRLGLSEDLTASPLFPTLVTVISAASETLKKRWFWYSIAASLCWTAWAFTARAGSEEIPATTMQFVSAFGFLLVGLVMVVVKKPRLKESARGNSYALISGVLLGLGGIALYGAYRAGDNASVVTATTSLYPVVTVLLAVTFLREKLNKLQLLGVGFAVTAILLLSL
jgi:transporter family protein